MNRILALSMVFALAVLPAPVLAQQENYPTLDQRMPQPPKKTPTLKPADPKAELDRLFGALKAAPNAEAAQYVEIRIWSLLFASGSDTVDLLMQRARMAVEGKDAGLAADLLDEVVEIAPDYAEGWNRRATIRFMAQDYAGAIADLGQALSREPRHFAAWTGLGVVLQMVGQDKRALDAFRKALEINPNLTKADEAVKSLTPKIEGQPI
jgi:tetratricopeptide (TPR) repeat protein